MFLIFGKRKAKIKTATDHTSRCSECNSLGLQLDVHRNYFHLFWIPLFPVGDKNSKVYCSKCGDVNSSNPRLKALESDVRTPIYLYAGTLIFLMLIATMVYANINTQKEKAHYVANPQVGDVYRIRRDVNDSIFYFFLRVARIQADTVVVYPNHLQYFGFTVKLSDDDYFVAEEYFYTKTELQEMLEKGEINSVDRGYGDYEGYNRIRAIEIDSVE